MLDEKQRDTLRKVARQSIEYGLDHGSPPRLRIDDYDESLRQHRATFVTLKTHGRLRGCIGMLEPIRSLIEDVSNNAFSAAFHDSRFTPLQQHELRYLDIHISILNPPEAMTITSEDDLASQLRKGTDGLILKGPDCKATFLPSVWDSVSDEHEFIHHLKLKAGLPFDYWSDDMQALRYTVEEF